MQKFVYRKDTKGLLVPFILVCVGRGSSGGVAPHTHTHTHTHTLFTVTIGVKKSSTTHPQILVTVK
jgi:hypothetical protein